MCDSVTTPLSSTPPSSSPALPSLCSMLLTMATPDCGDLEVCDTQPTSGCLTTASRLRTATARYVRIQVVDGGSTFVVQICPTALNGSTVSAPAVQRKWGGGA